MRGRGRLISSVGRDTALGIPSIRTTGAAAIVCVCGSGIDLGRLLDCPLEGALTGAALVRESLPPSFSEGSLNSVFISASASIGSCEHSMLAGVGSHTRV